MIPSMSEQLKEIYDKVLSMVFKIDSLEEASISKKLKASWLNKKEHQLENVLVNVGAATKLKLSAAKVSLEKKRKFRGDCKAVILNILIKFAENCPLIYRLIRSARCFNPLNMVRHHAQSSQLFKMLADHVFALHKIKASVADKSKSQMDEFLKVARFDQKEKFKNFDFRKDRLDVFFGDHLSKRHEELWEVFKVVCTLSHGQSFTERGFSVNKEVIDHNMTKKSITSQRTVYDDIQQHLSNKVSDFPISTEMRKSCSLSHQRYQHSLEKNKKEAGESDLFLKRKAKDEEIQKVKQEILGIESYIKSLREEVFKQPLLADETQDLVCAAKAA